MKKKLQKNLRHILINYAELDELDKIRIKSNFFAICKDNKNLSCT